MKKRRMSALVMCLLLLICLMAGCSASSAGGDRYGNAANDKYADAEDSTLGGSGSESMSSPDVMENRKLIRRISMDAETEDMDTLLADVNSRVAELGGYIESRNIQNGSQYSSYRSRSATLVLRLPAENLDAFLQQVTDASNVVSTVEESDDVTLQYAATESRLSVLRTEEARLLQFLSEAKSVSEMLDIEARLTQVQSEIESITTQLNTYDNLVDYGTVTLHITEVEVYTVVEEEEPTMWEQIADGFSKSIQSLLMIGKALLVFLLANSPYLIILGIIAAAVLLIIRSCKRKRRRRPGCQPPITPPEPPAQTE